MGLFFDAPQEKALREAVNNIAEIVGRVYEGTTSIADLREILDGQRPTVQSLYDTVALSRGPRAARKILDACYAIANIWADGNARPLMREVLESLDRPL